jgi:protein tyrosine phosphatase (PTP) superfamily phosphohydrolase (DUF442 family)
MTNRPVSPILALGCALLCGALATVAAPREGGGEPDEAFESVETADLHNAHRVTDKLLSGAAPENEQAFRDLRALGVRTIISVDGAKPDAGTAKRYGMRYVHLPIGYDDVTDTEGRQIAKALAELPGPVYLHCHHGKHRSAAAVAVACVLNGSLKPEQAESVLRTFGTGANYVGLWDSARQARPLSAAELADVKVDYVEHAKIPELAERMVETDKTWERLKAVQKNGWAPPADHPDLDAAHEALQLQEHLHETGRTPDTAARPAEYRRMLLDAEDASGALRTALAARPVAKGDAQLAFKRLGTACAACHAAYRD